MKKSFLWVLALMACTGLSVACMSVVPPTPTAHVSLPTTLPVSPTAVPVSQLGDAAEQSGYALSVTDLDYPISTDTYNAPKRGYKMVAVEVTLSNLSGTEPLQAFYTKFNLVDKEGYVYEASYGYENRNLDMVDLEIGEKVKGWVNFIIPESAVPTYIKYKVDSGIVLIAYVQQD